jgi:Uma2 family endonuclease
MTPILKTEERLNLGSLPGSNFDSGYRLSKEEFIRRYEARKDIRRAELLNGIVFIMASPVSRSHSQGHLSAAHLITNYVEATPLVIGDIDATLLLHGDNAVQPDGLLRVDPRAGGKATLTEKEYIKGPPELVIEISVSTESYDLTFKKDIYLEAGIAEYVVWQALDAKLHWFKRRGDAYEDLKVGDDGIVKSAAMPGFWVDVGAFVRGDLAALKVAMSKGLASPEHASFVVELKKLAEGAI